MAIRGIPKTRHQKGHNWATGTLLFCGAFSLYTNVRSGQIATEPVIISAFPPIVAFLSSKLIAYFNPRGWVAKLFVYGGFGIICVISMGASGFHIVDTVMRNGQSWYVGLMYIFITDAPMLLAAGILVQKVPTTINRTEPDKKIQTVVTPAIPATKTTPAKTTKPATKRTAPTKTTKPSQTAPKANILDDPLERDMLTA